MIKDLRDKNCGINFRLRPVSTSKQVKAGGASSHLEFRYSVVYATKFEFENPIFSEASPFHLLLRLPPHLAHKELE